MFSRKNFKCVSYLNFAFLGTLTKCSTIPMEVIFSFGKGKKAKGLWKCAVLALLLVIWQDRNKIIFKDKRGKVAIVLLGESKIFGISLGFSLKRYSGYIFLLYFSWWGFAMILCLFLGCIIRLSHCNFFSFSVFTDFIHTFTVLGVFCIVFFFFFLFLHMEIAPLQWTDGQPLYFVFLLIPYFYGINFFFFYN